MIDTSLVIASSAADQAAVEAVEAHHAQLAGALALRVQTLLDAARTATDAAPARADLLDWARTELMPHAIAEERTLYPSGQARPELRSLVEAMITEHRLLERLLTDLDATVEPVAAAAAGRALQVLFDSHLSKENDQLLTALAAAPDVSVAGLLEGMHELLGGHSGEAAQSAPAESHAHNCACGETDPEGHPELDSRVVPHAIRHATIFGALDSVRPGRGLVLVASHDPLPLLAQVEQRTPGAFEVSYLERGPEAWRLQFLRRSA